MSENENWYEDTILPASKECRQFEKQVASTEDLVARMNSLAVDSPVVQAGGLPEACETLESRVLGLRINRE